MDQLQTEVDSKQKVADIRMRTMFKVSYNSSHLSMILTSKNISDLVFKLEAVQKIISFDKRLLIDLNTKKEVVNKYAAELDVKNQQLMQIKSINMTSFQQLNTNKKELESLVEQFDIEKKASALIIEENENKLIAYSISIISSQTPTINNLKSAITTLKSLLPQLNTSSVKKKAENSIAEGNTKLAIMIAENSQQSTNADRGNTAYKATFYMVATAYTAHTLTATGSKPIRDPEGLSTIAVDPTVIPLGTKVYIPGYGYAICADTGGAIKGNKIDLFLNSTRECIQWGRRTVVLYVIAYPGEW